MGGSVSGGGGKPGTCGLCRGCAEGGSERAARGGGEATQGPLIDGEVLSSAGEAEYAQL